MSLSSIFAQTIGSCGETLSQISGRPVSDEQTDSTGTAPVSLGTYPEVTAPTDTFSTDKTKSAEDSQDDPFKPLLRLLKTTGILQEQNLVADGGPIDTDLEDFVSETMRLYEAHKESIKPSGYYSYGIETPRWGEQGVSFGCPNAVDFPGRSTVYSRLINRRGWWKEGLLLSGIKLAHSLCDDRSLRGPWSSIVDLDAMGKSKNLRSYRSESEGFTWHVMMVGDLRPLTGTWLNHYRIYGIIDA